MKKEDLVAKGLTEEQAGIAIATFEEAIKNFVPRERLDETTGKLKEANATIEQLKKSNTDNAELQQQIAQYKEKIEQLETSEANTRKTYALKEKLAAAGVLDPDYAIFKKGGLEKFTFDKDGNPVGITELVAEIKKDTPYLLKQESSGGYNPKAGNTPAGKNPFAKETFNLTEQGRLLRDNPEQAKQLAAAAGVKI